MKYLYTTAMILAMATSSFAGTVKLAWDYEKTGHKGFRLYYGTVSHADDEKPIEAYPSPLPYEQVVEIPDPEARMHEVNLPEGEYYFRLTAIGEKFDSVFTKEEPVARVSVDTPTGFRVEWIFYTRETQ